MNITAITSMDKKYYTKIGRSMLRSYKQHWSDKFKLHVYNEGNFEIKVKTIVPLGWDLGKDYDAFQTRHSNSKIKTFAKKGFSIIHAMENLDCDRLMWIDADVIILDQIPMQLLKLISPDDVLSTHFSVWHHWPSENEPSRFAHSCETGFFILNKRHPGFNKFKETYKDIYINDKTDGIRRFYDGEVYGKTVELLEQDGHRMMNLNPGRHKTPISRSVMSPYINHYKAGLKERIDLSNLEQPDDED